MGDLKNTVLTKEQVLNDPYGYTYNEILQVLGENTSKSLMADLYRKKAKNAHYTIKVKDYYNGKDTTKYAFEMEDGYCIETVCIKRKTGTTICISTMVGCPVGCIFCASGKNVLINVLQYNETECPAIKRPNKQQLVVFKNKLEEAGLVVKLRESRGNNIKAACGQLVSKFNRSTGKDGNSKSVKNSSERIVSKRTDTVAFIDKSSEKGRTKRKKNK